MLSRNTKLIWNIYFIVNFLSKYLLFIIWYLHFVWIITLLLLFLFLSWQLTVESCIFVSETETNSIKIISFFFLYIFPDNPPPALHSIPSNIEVWWLPCAAFYFSRSFYYICFLVHLISNLSCTSLTQGESSWNWF